MIEIINRFYDGPDDTVTAQCVWGKSENPTQSEKQFALDFIEWNKKRIEDRIKEATKN